MFDQSYSVANNLVTMIITSDEVLDDLLAQYTFKAQYIMYTYALDVQRVKDKVVKRGRLAQFLP